MVEQWSPKPKVKGSNPFSPDYLARYEEVADRVSLPCFIIAQTLMIWNSRDLE